MDRNGEICFLNVKVLLINHHSISQIQRILCLHVCACISSYVHGIITMLGARIDFPNLPSNATTTRVPIAGTIQCGGVSVSNQFIH